MIETVYFLFLIIPVSMLIWAPGHLIEVSHEIRNAESY
jgi:hypothetical protein